MRWSKYVSLAATFFKSHRALILLRLLSESNPLCWASIRAGKRECRMKAARYIGVHSRRCSSFSNRKHCVGLRFEETGNRTRKYSDRSRPTRHRALILLLLLFKQNPLRTAPDRAMIGRLRITAEMYVSRGKNS